ncbi:MAG: Hsp70 family protein [Anaerolinea sp.]|nr:Hsp70 family protein [Anaerolinea sp.]
MIIGMDFGTTNSGMAHYDGDTLTFVPIDGSQTVARTALYVTNERQIYLGRTAVDRYFEENLDRPTRLEMVRVGEITLTFAELPTFVTDVYVEKDVLAPGRLFLSFKMGLPSLDTLGTVVGSYFYRLEDIIAAYLYITKQRAEQHFGQPINRIVLGRPVRYSVNPKDDQVAWQRMLRSAFRAGYEEVYFQYEPIAAAYHYESTTEGEQTVLVFDFGGGTLDISVIRVGNPATRAVLANGGLPIAGDVFDQKIVRAKLPPHFGEGSSYTLNGKVMPVPSSFYEAFSHWQELMTLQRRQTLDHIEKIERTAQQPVQIRALRHLISSNYGLKIYDVVEAAKRKLSGADRAYYHVDAPDFSVYDSITRGEFEGIINAEIRQIDAYLDTLLRDAGIRPEQIDVVIRTGGSSLIPAFVHMLEGKFGADKVRALDEFSSVTAGLAITAQRIETGEISLKAYHTGDLPPEREFDDPHDAQIIDFETLKKYISLTEGKQRHGDEIVLVGIDGDVVAGERDADLLAESAPLPSAVSALLALPANTGVILMTTEYRLLKRSARELAQMSELGLTMADTAKFHRDDFGAETVSGLARADSTADQVLLVTSAAAYKLYARAALFDRLDSALPYAITRIKGDPVTLVAANGEIIAFSQMGRVVRISTGLLTGGNGRLMNLPADDRIIAAFPFRAGDQFVMAAANGVLQRVGNVAPASGLDGAGIKLGQGRMVSVARLTSPLWAMTDRRVFPLDAAQVNQPRALVTLAQGESLRAVFSLESKPT